MADTEGGFGDISLKHFRRRAETIPPWKRMMGSRLWR
jgi:hypothetical protein